MTKFTIGSQWKTRGGTRAIVIDRRRSDGWINVYYYQTNKASWISPDGSFLTETSYDLDLIEPWVDPKEYDVWVNVHKNRCAYMYDTKQMADNARHEPCLACVNVKFKEGDGL